LMMVGSLAGSHFVRLVKPANQWALTGWPWWNSVKPSRQPIRSGLGGRCLPQWWQSVQH